MLFPLVGARYSTIEEIVVIKYFQYQDLSTSVEKELALILGKITHHIHPKIVNYIAQKNIEFKSVFESTCDCNLNILPFFYSNSDCIFPGVRRPINKEKLAKWKNNIYKVDGTILNDNTFPRHIWAYLSKNKAYAGGLWSDSGLNKFELAHIFGHKQDERSLEKEVFQHFDQNIEPYGLFTSASNIVLIPKGFAKPTDHMRSIKICFYQRHIELYGNNIIGLKDLNNSYVPDWYKEIQWLEPQLVDGWKEKIDNLLKYREKYLLRKYSNSKQLEQKQPRPSNQNTTVTLNYGQLPISLEPADPDQFRQALLDSKLAVIKIIYTDGTSKTKEWRAEKFSATSNVLGNLRSRKEFRSTNWQSNGISKVHVTVK